MLPSRLPYVNGTGASGDGEAGNAIGLIVLKAA